MDENQISKFNRSFARSEPNLPNCRQINITECFRQPETGHQLIRQYSFRELRANSEGYPQFNDSFLNFPISSFNSQFCDNSTFSQIENFAKSSTPSVTNETIHNFNDDNNFDDTINKHNCSPMDIDQSEDQIDVSMKENNWIGKKLMIKSPTEETEEYKKENALEADVKSKEMDKNRIKNGVSYIHIFLSLSFAIVAIILFFNNTVPNITDSSIIDIETDLKSFVFNQNHIVNVLIHNLNKLHTSANFKKLLILAGSTGVGKTFLLNRLQKRYPNELFISLNYGLDKDVMERKKNISLPKSCFILSIDDLKIEHLENVTSYVKSLSSDCILVVAVFNIQETTGDFNHIVRYDNLKRIARHFDDNFSLSETLLFNVMDRKHLEMWIKDTLERRGIDIYRHDEFIKLLIENHDVNSYGFKGIIPKLNLLN